MRRRSDGADAAVTASLSKVTLPLSGVSRPFISRSKVDLPHPLGPINTVVRPAGISRLVGATARTEPKDLLILESANIRAISPERSTACKRAVGDRLPVRYNRRSREKTSSMIDSTIKPADR